MKSILSVILILPLCSSFNILICIPGSIKSLHGLFANVAIAAAERGHKVTFLSAYKLDAIHPNIQSLDFPQVREMWDSIDVFEVGRSLAKLKEVTNEIAKKGVRIVWEDERVMNLWKKRNEFDIFMTMSLYQEGTFPFLMDFDGSFVQFCTPGVEMLSMSREGNWLSPAVVPSILMNYDDVMTFWERAINLPSSFLIPYLQKSTAATSMNIIQDYFPDFKDILSYYDRVALTLINGHFALDGPVPLLPSQIEIGTINIKDPKPLPKDIEEFVVGSGEAGVIYFSLGSIAKSSSIPKYAVKVFLEAFKKLPQRVLWKYEDSDLELTKSVKIQKWMPQQDILGHPKTKLFISHCGNLGTQEAKYHGVPVLALPIAFDQPRNALRMARKGYALVLDWDDLTVDKIVETINTLINDTSYKERLEAVSRILHDQKDSPAERAVWWLEYVVRHKGAPHLQYAGKRLSLFQYLMLDVIFFWLTVVTVTICIFIYTMKFLCCRVKKLKQVVKNKKL